MTANLWSYAVIKTRGNLQSRNLPKLAVTQLHPEERREIKLDICGDPDCGNFGVLPDPVYDRFVGRGAVARRKAAGRKDPEIAAGLAFYTMTSVKDEERILTAPNFRNAPAIWSDGRRLVCRHNQGGARCKVGLTLHSNRHFLDEVECLKDNDSVFDGSRCGACGKRYFDTPEEFARNGADGKGPKTARPLGIRVIHKSCRGRKGARLTVSTDRQEQRDWGDNIKILSIQRVLTCPRTGERAGMSRIYDRNFWLERTLLAFERAQLGKWRKNLDRRGVFRHTRVVQDDIVLGINRETSADRRITALNCTASTDIEPR